MLLELKLLVEDLLRLLLRAHVRVEVLRRRGGHRQGPGGGGGAAARRRGLHHVRRRVGWRGGRGLGVVGAGSPSSSRCLTRTWEAWLGLVGELLDQPLVLADGVLLVVAGRDAAAAAAAQARRRSACPLRSSRALARVVRALRAARASVLEWGELALGAPAVFAEHACSELHAHCMPRPPGCMPRRAAAVLRRARPGGLVGWPAALACRALECCALLAAAGGCGTPSASGEGASRAHDEGGARVGGRGWGGWEGVGWVLGCGGAALEGQRWVGGAVVSPVCRRQEAVGVGGVGVGGGERMRLEEGRGGVAGGRGW